jgi:HSP20 family protein
MANTETKQTDPGRSSNPENRDRKAATDARTEGGVARRDPSTLSRGFGTPFGGFASPFGLMQRFNEEMDRLFQDFGFGRGWPSRTSALAEFGTGLWSPQVEVFQRGDRLVVRADLPGLRRDDINVEIRDDELVLSGERRSEHEEKREGLYRSECSYGSFHRSIPLPEGVNADSANARFENGVLEITIEAPQPAASRGRRLEIQEGAGQRERQGDQKVQVT